jgi:hypothetical protein
LSNLNRYNTNRDNELEKIMVDSFVRELEKNGWIEILPLTLSTIVNSSGASIMEFDGFVVARKSIKSKSITIFVFETKQVFTEKHWIEFNAKFELLKQYIDTTSNSPNQVSTSRTEYHKIWRELGPFIIRKNYKLRRVICSPCFQEKDIIVDARKRSTSTVMLDAKLFSVFLND